MDFAFAITEIILPSKAEVLNNKGTQLMQRGQFKSAIAFFRKAVSLDPTNLPMRTNLAVGLIKIPGCEQESRTILNEIVEIDSGNFTALHALGVLAECEGDHKSALAYFIKCQTITGPDSNRLGFDFDVATSLIQDGQWIEGWKQYECRRKWKPERTFDTLKTWDGTKDKKIYCWAEQGFGDTLQFSRYIPWLVSQSERVAFAVPACMYEIFQPFNEICDVFALEQGTPLDADYEIPLMSLPYLYGEEIPKDPELIQKTGNKFNFAFDKKTLNVGVAWAAGAHSIREIDRRVHLEDLVQLAGDSTRKLFSIQGDNRVSMIYELGIQQLIQDMTPVIEGDWCATRDLLRGLDAVVTTDSAVAHLAAIMKKPTIMLLCRMDNWRWQYDWYPTLTILRQSKRNCWDAELRQADVLLDKIALSIQTSEAA